MKIQYNDQHVMSKDTLIESGDIVILSKNDDILFCYLSIDSSSLGFEKVEEDFICYLINLDESEVSIFYAKSLKIINEELSQYVKEYWNNWDLIGVVKNKDITLKLN